MRVAVTLEQCWHAVPGGTARATLDTVAAVAATGMVDQVGVAARHRHGPVAGFEPPVEVAHLALPRTALYEAWHGLRCPPVQRATGPVDVIHATAHVLPPPSAPLVATVHDLHFLHRPDHFTRHGVRTFERFVALVRRDASIVVCPSHATAADCSAAGIDPGRIRVVPWGIDVRQVAAGAVEAVRRRYGLDRPYVLFVGTHEPRKNLPRLREAFGRLGRSDVELVLVGPAGWAPRGGEGAAAGVPGRVRGLGFVGAAERDALYAGAAVVAYPSLREGFGLPVLEALAQGAPVVTSAGTATAEVAGDAAVLVDPTDTAAIAAALASVLDDPALAGRLRLAGPMRAARFAWADTARATLAAYADAVAGARSAGRA